MLRVNCVKVNNKTDYDLCDDASVLPKQKKKRKLHFCISIDASDFCSLHTARKAISMACLEEKFFILKTKFSSFLSNQTNSEKRNIRFKANSNLYLLLKES